MPFQPLHSHLYQLYGPGADSLEAMPKHEQNVSGVNMLFLLLTDVQQLPHPVTNTYHCWTYQTVHCLQNWYKGKSKKNEASSV